MIIFDIFSIILLSILFFWAVYNGSIIYAGVRNKRKLSTNKGKDIEFPKFSIIVPTKNEEVVVGRCLGSLLNLDYPKDKMEIIIVDGNSSDSTHKICLEYVAKYPQLFRVINEKESRGKPAALNFALTYATGEIVGVFDADSVPEREVLQKAASYLSDKQVMAVQGRTISLNEKNNLLTRVASMEEKTWYHGLISGREKLQLFVPLNGSCQFIRRKVLEELGGWDETSLTEDVELAVRLVEKKYLIKYAPDVCSGQETPYSLRGLIKQRIRWYRGNMETYLKYGRLLNNINRRTVDAEISLLGPFIMVVSLLSYVNWFFIAVFLSASSPIINLTGIVIGLTAVSLASVGIALAASERPIKVRNLLWVPSVYGYWLIQNCIAGWAFLKMVFRQERVWSKTVKSGFGKSEFMASGFTPSISSLVKLPELKICFVSSYPPNHARLSEYAKSLVTALARRPSIGKIYLLADKTTSSKVDLRDDSKAKVMRVWEPDNSLSILGIMIYLFKLKPDVVHFNVSFKNYGHGRLANFSGLFLISLCRLFGFKVLVQVHALADKFDLKKAQLKPSLLNRIGMLTATKLILSAAKVVVTVRSYGDYLNKRYGYDNVQYIPHGTLENHISAPVPQTDEKVVLLFGHMGPCKGLSIMLKAFQELQKERSGVRLVVAGSNHPSYKGYLDQFINARLPNVDFLGYVPEENLAQVFMSSDVVVLPYLAAPGTSGVFHLACGFGRPIVASNLPEIREILAEGASALLVPPEDSEALKEGILKIISDRKLAARMGEQNLRFAHGENWNVVAEDYEKAYLELSAR